MTDNQLQQLAALAEAATPGPWWVDRYATDMSCTEHAVGVRTDDMMLASMGIDDVAMPDARFIAAARQAVPELLAEAAALRRQLAECQAWLERISLAAGADDATPAAILSALIEYGGE